MDSLDEGEECWPRTMNYQKVVLSFDSNPTPEVIEATCAASNGGTNTCATRTCIVELGFLIRFWVYYKQRLMGTYDPQLSTYQHSQGFPVDSVCAVTGEPSERECCGSYPTRFPYRILDGERKCCHDTTYMMAKQDCCVDPNGVMDPFVSEFGFGC